MSIHAKLSSEAADKLKVQEKRSQILSLVVACLSLLLIAGVFSLFALESLVKESPTILTCSASSEQEQEILKKSLTQDVQCKPSAPAPNNAKVSADNFLGKPVEKKAREMAEKTGGQPIEVVPGKG